MKENICPWCGKKINRFKDRNGVAKKKTPLGLRFAKCSYCDNYYGQSTKSKRCIFSIIGIVISIIAGAIYNSWICFFSFVFIGFVLTSPLKKMTEKEDVIIEKKSVYKIEVNEEFQKISKKHYYYFNKNFNDNEVFTLTSPIYVHKYNVKKRILTFSFMYDHQSNVTVFDGTKKIIYNRKGKVGIIQYRM